MTDIALVQVEAERRSAGSAGDQQSRLYARIAALLAFGRQVGVDRRARPDRRHRHHVAEVQRRHQGPTQIGIGLARQAADPGLDSVDVLDLADEARPVDGAFDLSDAVRQAVWIRVHQGDGRGEVADRGVVTPENGQGSIGVDGFRRRVRIFQQGRLACDRLLQERHHALALGEPALTDRGHGLARVFLVQRQIPADPAVADAQLIEPVEQAGARGGRVGPNRKGAQVLAPEAGQQAALEIIVGEKGVEVGRGLRRGDRMALGRDAAVQIGQGLIVGQFCDFRHDRGQDVCDLVDRAEEVAQRRAVHPLGAASRRGVFEQKALGRRDRLFRRQVGEGQEVAALEVTLLRLEALAALFIDQVRNGVWKLACGIGLRWRADGLDVQAPA